MIKVEVKTDYVAVCCNRRIWNEPMAQLHDYGEFVCQLCLDKAFRAVAKWQLGEVE